MGSAPNRFISGGFFLRKTFSGLGTCMKRVLMKGNDAMAEAAVRAGCLHYYGYPITPQNEVTAYLARRMPEVGGTFIQAESELAAINLVLGSAAAGARTMTSSSSPGVSLMQEGISYLAGSQLPAVIANVQRGGPGLGSIGPAQADYFQSVKGGGHGDYRLLVMAPCSVPETVSLTMLAFDLADKYRNPAMILTDGLVGQMIEPVEFDDTHVPSPPKKPWALTGCTGREPNIVKSLYLNMDELESLNRVLVAKYARMAAEECRWEEFETHGAEWIVTAYGSAARICKAAIKSARAEGLRVGLFRPITLFPWPVEAFRRVVKNARGVLDVELNCGQMIEDVRLALPSPIPVHFYGRTGGNLITPEEVFEKIREVAG